MITMISIGAMVALAGVAIVALAERTADGRIGPNQLLGIRTKAAKSSEDAWLAAHRASRHLSIWAGRAMVLVMAISVVVGVVVGGGEADRTLDGWATTLGGGLVVVCAALIIGAIQGHRAAVRVRDGSPLDR